MSDGLTAEGSINCKISVQLPVGLLFVGLYIAKIRAGYYSLGNSKILNLL